MQCLLPAPEVLSAAGDDFILLSCLPQISGSGSVLPGTPIRPAGSPWGGSQGWQNNTEPHRGSAWFLQPRQAGGIAAVGTRCPSLQVWLQLCVAAAGCTSIPRRCGGPAVSSSHVSVLITISAPQQPRSSAAAFLPWLQPPILPTLAASLLSTPSMQTFQ